MKSAFGLRRIMPPLAIVIGTLGLLAGCGVKGPLYMPTYPTAPGTQPAAPADEQLQAPDSTLPEVYTPSASPITQ
ncbi:LPS translocon maturation chaperone LptM [Oxalicibacterium flavum]|uniref:LPS translocon maturation chaperone LptM n=1 Tax=Oxalicibacterium flavum TaxID=179467 RepID=UPI001664DA42|nr:lipoprotein [Oxalicibacterium flavum]